MYQTLKSEICNIIEIVNQCPESLREKCFELLLTNFLDSESQSEQLSEKRIKGKILDLPKSENKTQVDTDTSATDEITKKDFHTKIQRFFESNGIGYDLLNKLYYKENGNILPLYETLNSTQMSECQIRLSVLTAFENAFASGNMEFDGESVRKRCQDLKCYDGANFAANLKKSSNLFDNWDEKYVKNIAYSLSAEGKRKLAEVLIDIAKGV